MTPRRGHPLRKVLAFCGGLASIALLLWFAIHPRMESTAALKKDTENLNVPTVAVISPKNGSPGQTLVLAGNMQALTEAPLYARTNGYIKRRLVDIGTRVTAGQLLAEIDTPEVDEQLQQARADLATATANYELARKTAERWQELLKSNTVSKQGADQTHGDMQAKKAALDSARFNVARLEKTQSFKRIFAPFAGVITTRNAEVGALVDAGAAGKDKELFHVAATDRLRVNISVPQVYSREITPGMEAELVLVEFPGRRFKGMLVRTAQSIDATSRTLQAEVEVDNPTGELLPGAYAQVHLKLHAGKPALILPVNALLFRPEGVQVAVVAADNKAVLKKVALGKDFGTQIEVVSGLDANEQVILNPSDSLISGTVVRPVKQQEEKKPGG
ncbi:MAG: efflux RND transporter periplasmic adaptor subunit [Betaproteobacteria bacterium]|nr:efflux RND transporter periplasmic adaptor subunit [Betaproteobacteria bacterium]